MGWTELIAGAVEIFCAAGLDSPEADARELAEVAGEGRLRGLLGSGAVPTPEQRAYFESMVAERATRVPLQHVTGVMYFRYLELVSRPGCFIVRPETELVAEEAITALHAVVSESHTSDTWYRILPAIDDNIMRSANTVPPLPLAVDLCTGSGAIALALATEVPGARVIGVELSEIALAVARENNAKYGSVVDLVHGDARTELSNFVGQVDVVVTNPPYVPPTHDVSVEALSDPALALWGGGADGTDLPRELIARAAQLLRPGGILIMEHAEEQAEALVDAALNAGFEEARTGYDYTGRPRWLWARQSPVLGHERAESKGHQ